MERKRPLVQRILLYVAMLALGPVLVGISISMTSYLVAESFGALPGRAPSLASDLRMTLDDPRIVLVLVRVDGEPAAAAKATTFAGWTYVSSVGTRVAFRGRSLAAIATRHVLTAGGRTPARAYLGVFSGNQPALRLYDRLGFASAGESPDLLLE